jgi:hypothetical protein
MPRKAIALERDMAKSTPSQIDTEIREILIQEHKLLREKSRMDFECFSALILGEMNNLHLLHFERTESGPKQHKFFTGFFDEGNTQIIQLLVFEKGYCGLLNVNLENGLGPDNERVSESMLRILWEQWKAQDHANQ